MTARDVRELDRLEDQPSRVGLQANMRGMAGF